MLNFCKIVCHISIQCRHRFSYLIPPHFVLDIVCNASHLLSIISGPFIGHPDKMKMWGKYVYQNEAWKVQCMSRGWSSKYVIVSLEMLGYGQLLNLI